MMTAFQHTWMCARSRDLCSRDVIGVGILLWCSLLVLSGCGDHQQRSDDAGPPNIVIIFLDDAGWADFQPFSETRYPTPNVSRLAEEGRRFTNFYVPQAVCSASRAALLTGTYPERNGVFGAHAPGERGLDPEFVLMSEMLQARGYATGFFGKWHIGDQPETRPDQRGFDDAVGIMYSNDMWADHPVDPDFWGRYPLRFWKNGEVVIDSVTAVDQTQFTTWFTEEAVDFIHRNSENPFFLYLPHPMPHVPLFVSDKFKGASGTGLYGDVMMELDWSVGEIMTALEEEGIRDQTIIIFTSDNGPWLSYGNHAGQTPFREGKSTSFDGGVRTPLIISYPSVLEKNTVSHDLFFSIDFMPTIAALTGSELPPYEMDGMDIWSLIVGEEGAENPHDYYAITRGSEFQAVISGDGKWKLILPHRYVSPVTGGRDGGPGDLQNLDIDWALFDLIHDPYEKLNVIDRYPEVAEQMIRFAQEHDRKFFDAGLDLVTE